MRILLTFHGSDNKCSQYYTNLLSEQYETLMNPIHHPECRTSHIRIQFELMIVLMWVSSSSTVYLYSEVVLVVVYVHHSTIGSTAGVHLRIFVKCPSSIQSHYTLIMLNKRHGLLNTCSSHRLHSLVHRCIYTSTH